ncbi:MAG: hypothetical protein IT582_00640, partial [Opitutaceae bacterium]|nr:hypothetical protein [Opitutaceae bacterium]
NLALTDAARDDLRILGTEIEDGYRLWHAESGAKGENYREWETGGKGRLKFQARIFMAALGTAAKLDVSGGLVDAIATDTVKCGAAAFILEALVVATVIAKPQGQK